MFNQLHLPTLYPYAQGYFAPLLLQLYYDTLLTLLTTAPKSKVRQRNVYGDAGHGHSEGDVACAVVRLDGSKHCLASSISLTL